MDATIRRARRTLAALWYVGTLACFATVAMLAEHHHDVFWTANCAGGAYLFIGGLTLMYVATLPGPERKVVRENAWLCVLALFNLAMAFAYSWVCSLPMR